MLHERQAGRRPEVGPALLLGRVRRVIGRDDVDPSRVEGREQGFAVGGGLDGRIALDARPEFVVARVVEPQVMDADLGRDPLVGPRRIGEQRHLCRGGQVEHVQPRIVPAREVDRETRRREAGFGRADVRMFPHRHLFAVLLPGPRLVAPDGRRVLAVGGDLHRCIREDLLQRLRPVDEHVAGRCPHEHLDPAGIAGSQGTDLVDVVVRGAQIESVVRRAASLCGAVLVGQRRYRRRLRIDVGHVEEAGDAAGRGSRRLRGEIALAGQAGLAEVHLVVDHARHQVSAGRVDHLRAAGTDAAGDPGDPVALDEDVRVADLAFVDYTGILYEESRHRAIIQGWRRNCHASPPAGSGASRWSPHDRRVRR